MAAGPGTRPLLEGMAAGRMKVPSGRTSTVVATSELVLPFCTTLTTVVSPAEKPLPVMVMVPPILTVVVERVMETGVAAPAEGDTEACAEGEAVGGVEEAQEAASSKDATDKESRSRRLTCIAEHYSTQAQNRVPRKSWRLKQAKDRL